MIERGPLHGPGVSEKPEPEGMRFGWELEKRRRVGKTKMPPKFTKGAQWITQRMNGVLTACVW